MTFAEKKNETIEQGTSFRFLRPNDELHVISKLLIVGLYEHVRVNFSRVFSAGAFCVGVVSCGVVIF